jgi:hypothetical protein
VSRIVARRSAAELKSAAERRATIEDAKTGRLIRLEESRRFKGAFTVESFGEEKKKELEQHTTITIRVLSENPLK